VATDSEGKEHVPGTWGGESRGNSSNDTAIFHDLPLSSIKEFRFQVRPYYWVEFKNVSLQSGQKTDVTVISSEDSVKTEK
jgi:hypothetical protein